MTTSIKCRRDTTENRATTNSVLADGEFGVEKMSDGSRKLKIGDGLTTWNNLPYFENGGGGGGGLYEILDDATIDLDNLTEPKTYIYKTPCVNGPVFIDLNENILPPFEEYEEIARILYCYKNVPHGFNFSMPNGGQKLVVPNVGVWERTFDFSMSTPRSEWAFKSMATSDQLVKYISSIDSPDLKYLPSGTYLVTGTPTNTPPSFSSEGDIVLVRSIEWNNEGVTYSKVTLTSVLLGTTRTRDYNSDDGRFQWVGIYSTVMPLATKLYIDYKIGKNELESYKNTMKVELANAEGISQNLALKNIDAFISGIYDLGSGINSMGCSRATIVRYMANETGVNVNMADNMYLAIMTIIDNHR